MTKKTELKFIPRWLVAAPRAYKTSIRENSLATKHKNVEATILTIDERQTSLKNLVELSSDTPAFLNQALKGMYVKHICKDTALIAHTLWGAHVISISHAAYHKLVEEGPLDQQELIVVVNKGIEVCLIAKKEADQLKLPTLGVVDNSSLTLTPGTYYRSATRSEPYLYVGISRFSGNTMFMSEEDPSWAYRRSDIAPYVAVDCERATNQKLEALMANNYIRRGNQQEVLDTLLNGTLKTMSLTELLQSDHFYYGLFNKNENLFVMLNTENIDIVEMVASTAWNHPEVQQEATAQGYLYKSNLTAIENLVGFINHFSEFPSQNVNSRQTTEWRIPKNIDFTTSLLIRKVDACRITDLRKRNEGYTPKATRLHISDSVEFTFFYVTHSPYVPENLQVCTEVEYFGKYNPRRKSLTSMIAPQFANMACTVVELSHGELVTPTSEYMIKTLQIPTSIT